MQPFCGCRSTRKSRRSKMLTFRFTLASITCFLPHFSFLVSMESAIESVYVGDPFTWTGATPTHQHTHAGRAARNKCVGSRPQGMRIAHGWWLCCWWFRSWCSFCCTLALTIEKCWNEVAWDVAIHRISLGCLASNGGLKLERELELRTELNYSKWFSTHTSNEFISSLWLWRRAKYILALSAPTTNLHFICHCSGCAIKARKKRLNWGKKYIGKQINTFLWDHHPLMMWGNRNSFLGNFPLYLTILKCNYITLDIWSLNG